MSEKRQQLLDRIIAIYGYEHKVTIWFANLCEEYPDSELQDKELEIITLCHEANPYEGDE